MPSATTSTRRLAAPGVGRVPAPGLNSVHGAGARTAGRFRATARAAPAKNRLDRPGRARGARRHTGQALDQARGEDVRARARGSDDRPDDAGGLRHAGQGRRPGLEGDPARPVRPERALGGGRLRLPEPRAGRGRARSRQRRQGRVGRDRVPVRPVAARDEARGGALGGRARRGRGGHGDRPRLVPGRPLREGLRRDRAREGGLRRDAPEGDPRDR